MKRRSVWVAAVLVSALLFAGCKKRSAALTGPGSPSASAATAASERPPLDHLASDELPPGTAVAFGLVLPKGMKLVTNFPGKAEAIGPLRPEEVANYIRDHVSVSHVELGAVGTVFPAAHVNGTEPDQILRIEVVPLGDRTKVVVRNVTPSKIPIPIDPNETDEMRLRKAGYDTDGTLKDRLKVK